MFLLPLVAYPILTLEVLVVNLGWFNEVERKIILLFQELMRQGGYQATDNVARLVWIIVSIVGLLLGLWSTEYTTPGSFVWCIGAIIGLLSLPGVLVVWLFLIGIALIVLVLAGILKLIEYFLRNLW